jgi:hypothetical protein
MTYPGDCHEVQHDDEPSWKMLVIGVLLIPFALLVRGIRALVRR